MTEPFLAEIRLFCGTFAPQGWAFCNGQLLPIAQNEAVFSLIGTTYGGDGIQTFGLPNLQGRLPIGSGAGAGLTNRQLGEAAGTESVTLLTNQLPTHNHGLVAATVRADDESPAGNLLAAPTTDLYAQPGGGATLASATLAPAGGNQPASLLQPALCVSFIIALEGIFPARG